MLVWLTSGGTASTLGANTTEWKPWNFHTTESPTWICTFDGKKLSRSANVDTSKLPANTVVVRADAGAAASVEHGPGDRRGAGHLPA